MEGQPHLGRLALSTGIALPYRTVGPRDAPPALLLHAWAESRHAFDPLLAALPTTVHAVALDLRGHGDAEAPETGYSLDDFADDVAAFIDAADLGPAVLLGASSGGYVAQQVAVTHPEKVAGLLLAGSPRTLQGRPSFAAEVERLRDPVPDAWVRDSLTWFPLVQDVPRSYVDDRVADGVRTPALVWRETFRGLCAAVPPTDAGTITCPTLVVGGDRDELLGREQQQDLARAIPLSQLVTYEDTGHLVLWEQPQKLADDLAAFVRHP